MRTAFLQSIVELMKNHQDVITLTADMGFSVFEDLQKEFPNRFINTGVTEQSSVGLATGLALSGYKVFFYAQAPFATMRCFEQIRLDIAYSKANVKVVGVASGFSSNQLGISHFSLEDIALMRLLPGMTVLVPGDPVEAKWATNEAYKKSGPFYIRLSKSGSPIVHLPEQNFRIGKGIVVKEGRDAALFVSGTLLPMAVKIHEFLLKKKIQISIVSMHTVKPLDEDIILLQAKKTKKIFSLEDHSILGGLGTAIAEVIALKNIQTIFHRFGVPDKFTSVTGTVDYLLGYNGLSVERISKEILKLL